MGVRDDDTVLSAVLERQTKELWKRRISVTICWKWQKPFPKVGGIFTKP